MSIFKCKMCGGTLEINNNETVGVCEYCGTKQTLPKLDDDKKINLYDRANHFRRNNDYDKAMSIYENILNEDKTDAEAYWSLVLCRYGIEYVEDPATHKRVPTVNRAQFTSVFMDEDYKSAIEYADPVQKSVYEEEAKAIDEIQKGILEISQKEEPFDVFICYKETDANGRRTQDSVLANDLYHQLSQEGFKVFFSRITLEDKLGTAYEPYIFAALNSAKVMVVIGTKPEYFNAVWVKNEWSRYLALIRNGAKKVLIPAYRDMDPYDLPEEFSHLQAQDMSKLGFMQDLLRGIRKIADAGEQKSVKKETVVVNNANTNTAPLLKRAFMFLEDGDWQSADEYCEKVLDLDPENAQAYLGKLMAQLCVKQVSMLKDCKSPFDYNNNYRKAYRFADDKLKSELEGYIKFINDRNENDRLEDIYSKAESAMKSATDKDSFVKAAELFESIEKFKNSKELAKQCREKGEEAYRKAQYDKAVSLFENPNNEADCEAAKSIFEKLGDYKDSKSYLDKYDEKVEEVRKDAIYYKAMETKNQEILDMDKKIENLEKVIQLFESVSEWKDAEKQAELCCKEIEEIKAKQKALELEAAEEEKNKKRKIKLSVLVLSVIAVVVAFLIVLNAVIIPNGKYNDAIALMDAGKFTEAISALEALEGYKDSATKINECNNAILDTKYNDAMALMDAGKFTEAISALEALEGYKDSATKINECNNAILDTKYNDAMALMDAGKFTEAISALEALEGYKDSATKINECNNAILDTKYNNAIALMDAGNVVEAYEALAALDGYKDSADKANSIYDQYKVEKLKTAKAGDYVFFGKYEQDNNTSNGKEDVEWLVLEVKDGKTLVISKYALDCKQYYTSETDVTWETCTLRKWLNNDFLGAAFSAEEKAMIPTVTVSADKNPEYSTNPGNSTQDQVFLLSITEANKYFSVDSARQCKPTEYAVANGAHVDSDNSNSWWLLRSPGIYQYLAAFVHTNGVVFEVGIHVDIDSLAVRPALWIDLNS